MSDRAAEEPGPPAQGWDQDTWPTVAGRLLNAYPANMICPYCKTNITTITQPQMGLLAWLVAGVLCITCLWPCAFIPCCIDDLKDVTHQCPSCKAILGVYKKIN